MRIRTIVTALWSPRLFLPWQAPRSQLVGGTPDKD